MHCVILRQHIKSWYNVASTENATKARRIIICGFITDIRTVFKETKNYYTYIFIRKKYFNINSENEYLITIISLNSIK